MLAVKHASLDAAGSLCATQPSQKRWHSGELSWSLKATWYAASIQSFSFIHSSSHYTHVIPDSQVCTVQGTIFALVLKHVHSSIPLHQGTAYHVIPISSFALVLKHVNSSIPNHQSCTRCGAISSFALVWTSSHPLISQRPQPHAACNTFMYAFGVPTARCNANWVSCSPAQSVG